ncbi:coiled-coil domain-containing protein 17 [Phascolarctos cinereus]|uniref:Coiled-coil domain-containing protein 17 isoform X2 n=1 Tax=Phascolarctos cinereus TaxID=38626 RepID=A0A6P5KCN6_PHACI|nr:coiled-coil domain-containing protein 17 isoform X2 [Phascolarctos cinereus]
MASGPEEPGEQGTPGLFPCSACDMVFPSRTLRDSHAYRFCIGHLTPGIPRGRRKSPGQPSASLPLNREGQSHQPEDQQETPRKAPGQGESSGAALKRLTDEVQNLRVSLQDMAFPQKVTVGSRAHLEAAYAHRLAQIGARTRSLEKHQEEIRQQLGGLAGGDAGASVLGQVMLAIQAQEKRTQQALDALGERVEKLQAWTQPDLPSVRKEEQGLSLSLLALPASQGVLTSEIRALQTSYLQAGGRDPGVLAKIWELHLEAALLEGRTQKRQGKAAVGPQTLDTQLQALEAVNGHLETEILALQMQRGPQKPWQGPWEPQPKEGTGLLWRGRGGCARRPPPVAPPLPPPLPGPPRDSPFLGMMEITGAAAQSHHLLPPPNVLGPAPYDPGAGFAIFYDFLLGLEPEWSQVQLVTALARGGQETGPSTALPPSPCLPLPPAPGAPLGNCAILAARQPVPRLHPSLAVTLVTELQAWGLWDRGQEPRPQAWTNVQLFDLEQRVLSGHWRLPLRALPRAPGLHPRQLNAIPQAGHIELYLRIANARDAEIQALAKIDPAQSREYRYLPTVSNSPSLEDSNLNSHFLGPPSLLPSLSLSYGFNDPPPASE